MRENNHKQSAIFSDLTLAQRIPADHPAGQIRASADRALARMDAQPGQSLLHGKQRKITAQSKCGLPRAITIV
jgi:hypothetical protein